MSKTTQSQKTSSKRTKSKKSQFAQIGLFEDKTIKSNAKEAPSFERDAFGFLISYAKRRARLGVPFCAEEVTLAAQKKGIAPKDLRSWGSIFVAAQKEGYIRRCYDKLFQRAMGNKSLTPGWIGC